MPEARRIHVSVMHAEPGRAFNVELVLPEDATVGVAIEASGIRAARPDIEIDENRLGVFARKATLATRLRNGDRVEIYRPLQVDPKEARRNRAMSNPRMNANKRE